MVNKRGSLADVIFGSAWLLKIAMTILICLFVWVSFNTVMTGTIVGLPVESELNAVMTTLTNAYFSMDYVFPFIVGGLLLVSSILAYKTGANYILAFFSIILWCIALLLSALFVNIYITASAQFPTIYADLPIMDVIMTNLHWIVLFWLAILSILLFRKNNAEEYLRQAKRALLPQFVDNQSHGYNSTEFIGNIYQITRTIMYRLAIDHNWDNVYSSPALPSGTMGTIKINKVEE
jgi:hypothetical protein